MYTVDKKPVHGLNIAEVVQLITGAPNSRVELHLFRSKESLDIPPTPTMIAPFHRKEIVLLRKLDPSEPRTSTVAGLGILFHKVIKMTN